MGTLAAGQVVLLPFPFSDLTRSYGPPCFWQMPDAMTGSPARSPAIPILIRMPSCWHQRTSLRAACSEQAMLAPVNYSPPTFPCLPPQQQACSRKFD